MPSINLAVWLSDGASPLASVLTLFRLAATEADADACLAASAGGSSRTSSYSLRIRDIRPARSADSKGSMDGRVGLVRVGCGSEVVGNVYWAPKSSLVRFADDRTWI